MNGNSIKNVIHIESKIQLVNQIESLCSPYGSGAQYEVPLFRSDLGNINNSQLLNESQSYKLQKNSQRLSY